MARFTALRLLCVAVVTFTIGALGFGQDDSAPAQSSVIDRLIADLVLSEPQAVALRRMYGEFEGRLSAIEAEGETKRLAMRDELTRRFYPELDPSVDISDRPIQERIRIESDRELVKSGAIVWRTMDATNFRNNAIGEIRGEVNKKQRTATEEFISEFEQLLASSQYNRYPFAVERLRIHLADSNVERAAHDPRYWVDLLGLLDEASKGELEPFAEAIENPQEVLERDDDPLQPVAIVVRDFLIAYSAAIQDWSDNYRRFNLEWINHANAGEYEEAARPFEARQRLVRSIWEARLRLVDQLGTLASTMIGDDARDAWLSRAHERFCPMLFAEDSVDVVVSHLRAIEDLPADALAGVESVYSDYVTRRNADRPRIARLEITEVGTAKPHFSDEPATATTRLEEANNGRIERADQAHTRFKSFLPEELKTKVDAWVKKHRDPVPGTPAHQIKP